MITLLQQFRLSGAVNGRNKNEETKTKPAETKSKKMQKAKKENRAIDAAQKQGRQKHKYKKQAGIHRLGAKIEQYSKHNTKKRDWQHRSSSRTISTSNTASHTLRRIAYSKPPYVVAAATPPSARLLFLPPGPASNKTQAVVVAAQFVPQALVVLLLSPPPQCTRVSGTSLLLPRQVFTRAAHWYSIYCQ